MRSKGGISLVHREDEGFILCTECFLTVTTTPPPNLEDLGLEPEGVAS